MGRNRAAAGRPALAVDDQVVAVDLDLDPVRLEVVGDGGEPIGFLHAQLLKPAHDGGAMGEARSHRQDRLFVDHRRRARGRHLDAAQRGRPHAEIGHLLAAACRRAAPASLMSAPISRKVVMSPVRSGLVMTSVRITSEPGTISAATVGNAAEEGFRGHHDRRRPEPGSPLTVILRPSPPSASILTSAPNGPAGARCGRGSPHSRSRWFRQAQRAPRAAPPTRLAFLEPGDTRDGNARVMLGKGRA